jgi:hypothetical protein
LQIEPYGNGSYIAGATAPAYRAFRIALQYHDSHLFGTARSTKNPSDADVHAIPLWMMPKNQLDIFFDVPNNVVSRLSTYVAEGALTASYQLSNLHLETYWLQSESLAAKVKAQGWAAKFRSSLPYTVAINPQLTGTTLSV